MKAKEAVPLVLWATYIGFQKNSIPRKIVFLNATYVSYYQRKTKDKPNVDESQPRTVLRKSFEKWACAQVLI